MVLNIMKIIYAQFSRAKYQRKSHKPPRNTTYYSTLPKKIKKYVRVAAENSQYMGYFLYIIEVVKMDFLVHVKSAKNRSALREEVRV
jgi:hypothetical protein